MMIIPLKAVASQTLTVILDGQNCQLNVYSKNGIIYLDVYLNNALVIQGVQCENGNRIIRDEYFGFSGDFIFYDTLGQTDPAYAGLGSQYLLIYLEASDLTTLKFVA